MSNKGYLGRSEPASERLLQLADPGGCAANGAKKEKEAEKEEKVGIFNHHHPEKRTRLRPALLEFNQEKERLSPCPRACSTAVRGEAGQGRETVNSVPLPSFETISKVP